ncbi:MAG TPA: TonB-dependent receptor plug domain-containing protein, partial [Segetibacter sp.]
MKQFESFSACMFLLRSLPIHFSKDAGLFNFFRVIIKEPGCALLPLANPAISAKYLPKFFISLFLGCMLCFTNQVFSQAGSKTIAGVVRATSGETLSNVTVSVKGTNTATTSDGEGRYSIKVPNAKSVLIFTNVGFGSYEVTVGTKTEINVSITSSSANMEDVVVIGYGSVKKKDITGSVGRVNMEDLQKAPVKSFDDALAGRVAGVQVTSNDGQPGSNAEINIRGVGSVTQSSAPLYVIDGFPQETANANSINPAEIESIEVLKDASATAIYGARGANGVIIITTKRGKSPKATINYNGYYGGQKVIKKMDLMSPYEFVRLQNDINPYYANLAYFSNGKTLEDYKNEKGIDWQDLTFNDLPTFQNHYISLSSKQNRTAYT